MTGLDLQTSSKHHVRSGIVIPTLGNRPEYLKECIASAQNTGECLIVLVAPAKAKIDISDDSMSSIITVKDPGAGLAEAINAGMSVLPESIKFCSWIGDDDLLEPNAIRDCEEIFDINPDAVMVFGGCRYITSDGLTIGISKSGQWAVPILRFGPCLIPQPGSLFRRKVFDQIGGLDSTYGWAFDFDLFIRFSKVGKLIHTKKILASFRWHNDSLTVSQRRNSVHEASLVRRTHLPKHLVYFSYLWELPVKTLTLHAGRLVAHRASKSLDH